MSDGYFACGFCHALSVGVPPHGWGSPCPHQSKFNDANVAMLDAQRMYYIRAGTMGQEALEIQRRMADEIAPLDEDEEED